MKSAVSESTAFWGIYDRQIQEWMQKCEKNSLVKRIWQKDPTLWTKSVSAHKEIKERLGWLTIPRGMKMRMAEIKAFKEEIKKAGYTHALLLGMGGSSLAAEVMQNILGHTAGFPELFILDSTDPVRIQEIESKLDLAKTLFIVSSKSGGTLELVSLFKYFFEKIKQIKPDAPGQPFIAITDPGTSLEKTAKENGFSRTFLAPPDVGGRFSALTWFGIVPACVIGADVSLLLDRAEKMMESCAADVPYDENPALLLGLGMAVLAESGRDKLTLVTTPKLESFGDWAEQLVAESTGKEGSGIVPVVREGIQKPEEYGPDRFFVALVSESESNEELNSAVSALEKAGHPVLTLRLKENRDLFAEFFRWEMATAMACSLLKVNTFDQPDVQLAKASAGKFLDQARAGAEVKLRQTEITPEEFWENAESGDYAAILAFLPDREDFRARLLQFRDRIREKTHLAATLGFGPRYLHSTGQLHKGGPNNGVFVLITSPHDSDLPVPGEPFTFGQLELAQAMGDFEALESKARWLIHLRLPKLSAEALDKVCLELETAIKGPVQ